MRKVINKLRKNLEKVEVPKDLAESAPYKALMLTNLIMNCFDDMMQFGYNPLGEDEEYINARHTTHLFMSRLVKEIQERFYPNETISKEI